MPDQSRRNFMKTASIAAGAAGAVGVAGSFVATDADAATGQKAVRGPAHAGPFTVWVKDARTGTIAVLVGESEVVHHDPALAKKLAQLAARGTH